MSQKTRKYFFTGPQTTNNRLFRKNNRPNETTFKNLLDSIPFFREANSEGSESQQGLFKKATNNEAIDGDNVNKAVMPYQLPRVFLFPDESQNEDLEAASGGLGLWWNRADTFLKMHLRLRADSLPIVNSIDEEEDYVVITRPNEPLNKNKTLRVPVNKFNTGNNTSGFSQAFLEPSTIVFREDNSNITYFKVIINNELYPLSNSDLDDNITFTLSSGLSITKSIEGGKVKVVVTNAPMYNDARIQVMFQKEINGQNYTLVAEAVVYRDPESIPDYSLYISDSIVHMLPPEDGSTIYTFSTGIGVLDNVGTSINFENIEITSYNLPDHITAEIDTNNSTNITKYLKITLDTSNQSTNIDSGPYIINFNVSKEGLFNLDGQINVIDGTIDVMEVQFVPDQIYVPVNNAYPGVNTKPTVPVGKIVLKENGIHVAIDASKIQLYPSSTYNGSVQQNGDDADLLITNCGDGAGISFIYDGKPWLGDDAILHWKQDIEVGNDVIYLKPNNIVYNVDTYNNAKKSGSYISDIYLFDINKIAKDLNITDVLIDNPSGLTYTLTQKTNSDNIKYIQLSITNWDNNVDDVFNLNIRYNVVGKVAESAILGVVKSRDGAPGSGFSIDAKGIVDPVGAGYANENPDFVYLRTDTGFVYFKEGASGTDTWSDPVQFKGDDGSDGLPPEHNWNNTILSFKNPDGTWGSGVELKGDQGIKGDERIPYKIEIDPATGRLVMYFDNGTDPDTILTTTNKAKGDKGEPGDSVKGDPGVSINWLGNLADYPENPSINDAFRHTSNKKSYVYTQAGTWSIIAEDGEDLTESIPSSLVDEDALKTWIANNTLSSNDVGKTIYLTTERKLAVIHYISSNGVGSYKISEVLFKTPIA